MLLDALAAWIVEKRGRLAYAFVPTEDPAVKWLQDGCYQLAGDMLLLLRPLDASSPAADGNGLEFVPYLDRDCQRLGEVLRRCCVMTRDHPLLDGVLEPQDQLELYANTGQSGTAHWRIVVYEGRDVGCLLLADHGEGNCCELVYMGLVPEGRGQAWGQELTGQALRLGLALGRSCLVAAVAAGNDPAIVVYSRAGFVQADRRAVLVRQFPETGSGS